MRYIRDLTPGATYFFTLVTAGRRPIFADAAMVDLLREVVRDVRGAHPFDLDAAVILPDHLHCIWTLPDGDADYPLRWGLIKAGFSRRCGLGDAGAGRAGRGERGVWQRRYWEHRIRDADDLSRHLDYVHFNPVRHGLCAAPWDWPHSSFQKWVRRGMYPPTWEMAAPPRIAHDRFDPR